MPAAELPTLTDITGMPMAGATALMPLAASTTLTITGTYLSSTAAVLVMLGGTTTKTLCTATSVTHASSTGSSMTCTTAPLEGAGVAAGAQTLQVQVGGSTSVASKAVTFIGEGCVCACGASGGVHGFVAAGVGVSSDTKQEDGQRT